MSKNTLNDPDNAPPPEAGRKPRSLGRTLKRLALTSLLAVTVAAGVIVYLVRSEPAY